ncbi:MAG: DUF2378 family protein [Sandaracinaceae bacterium]
MRSVGLPHEPPWDEPIDVASVVAEAPASVTTKGLFLTGLADQIVGAGGERPGSWVAFADYPVREYIQLLADCAAYCHPELSLGRAIRRVGNTAYPTFAATTLGRVIFAFAGKDPKAALRLAPRAYQVVSAGTSEVTLEEGDRVDVLRMRDIYSFAELHEVGVIEGGIRQFGGDVHVRVFVHGPGAVDLHVHWT